MFRQLVLLSVIALALAAPRVHQRKFKPLPDGRIVGGEDADIADYPHQISLQWYGSHICGGSIVDETHVVTAAHCTDGSVADDFTVRAGSSILESGGQEIQVSQIDQNPQFDYWTIDFDVSVLTLAEPLQLGTGVGAIGLPSAELDEGQEVTCSGWGATSEGGDLAEQLQVVTVPIVSRENCQAAYGADQVTDNMICAGLDAGGKDSCQGDSGGPLNQGNTLYGIVSWGYGCAEAGYPGVYSNVVSLRSFIDSVLSR